MSFNSCLLCLPNQLLGSPILFLAGLSSFPPIPTSSILPAPLPQVCLPSLVAHTAAGLIWKQQHLLSHSPAQACQWLPTSCSLKYKCLRAATGLNIPSVCLPPPPSLSPSQTRPVPTPQTGAFVPCQASTRLQCDASSKAQLRTRSLSRPSWNSFLAPLCGGYEYISKRIEKKNLHRWV